MPRTGPINRQKASALPNPHEAENGRPDVAALRIVWECYLRLQTGPKTLVEIAKELDTKPDAIYRSIASAERAFGIPLIKRTRGHSAVVVPEQEALFVQIGQLCAHYDDIFDRGRGRIPITLGSGITFAVNKLPDAARQFVAQRPDVGIRIVYGQPNVLLELERKGELDLAVVAYPHYMTAADNVRLFRLRMALIVPRGHPILELIANQGRFEWPMLQGHVIALLSERSSMPPYPPEIYTQKNVRIQSYDSFALVHSLVAAGAAVTFSIPQLLTDAERAHVHVLRYASGDRSANDAFVTYALIRSRARNNSFKRLPEELDLVERLAESIELKLHRMESEIPGDDFNLPRRTAGYYVVLTERGPKWLWGRFDSDFDADLVFHGRHVREGFVDPDANIYSEEGRDNRAYTIAGRVERHTNGQVHLIVEGVREDETGKEVFAVQFLASSLESLRKPRLVGTWIGRQTVSHPAQFFIPRVGFAVLLGSEEAEQRPTEATLNRIVEDFQQRWGPLRLDFSLPNQ